MLHQRNQPKKCLKIRIESLKLLESGGAVELNNFRILNNGMVVAIRVRERSGRWKLGELLGSRVVRRRLWSVVIGVRFKSSGRLLIGVVECGHGISHGDSCGYNGKYPLCNNWRRLRRVGSQRWVEKMDGCGRIMLQKPSLLKRFMHH
ncbi:hypothetical protein JHK87_009522 [Glycine soja]|nr:hypothetical protein JHK87_009522 [Glycine soja]